MASNIDEENGGKNNSIENVNTWIVEWRSSLEEFDDYSKALNLFKSQSADGKDVILYEVTRSKSDGSIMKKIPLLNSKQSRKRKEEQTKMKQEKMKEEEPEKKGKAKESIKFKIIILIVVVIAFIILVYIVGQLATTSDIPSSHFLKYYPNNVDYTNYFLLSSNNQYM